MKLTQEQINELKAKLGLTDFQATELKARLATFSAQADQAADGFLAKIGKSKYTWLIIITIVAAVWALGFIQR
jgi:hypothetical protein